MTADDLPAAFAALPHAWRRQLSGWTPEAEGRVIDAVRRLSGGRPIAPADPFRALRLVAPEAVKVVVFGQDPYPGEGHADGLAFSAPASTRPSLRRIFDVLESDRPGWRRPRSGRLDAWAAQGVLLLNPTLTVEVGRKNSHTGAGWQSLTAEIVSVLAARPGGAPVFLLWGEQARAFMEQAHPAAGSLRILRTRHPSNDFERGFMREGSHFVATREWIDWWGLSDFPV